MNNDRKQQPNEQSGEQNPTLNSPGSKVADYGSPTGGSSPETPEQGSEANSNRSGNAGTGDKNETIGNP